MIGKTKYHQGIPKQLIDYYYKAFDAAKDQEAYFVQPCIIDFIRKIKNKRTVHGVCGTFAISLQTYKRWIEKYPKFKDAHEMCEEIIKRSIIQGSSSGKVNANIAKLLLNVESGMIEKKDVSMKHSGTAGVRFVTDFEDDE